ARLKHTSPNEARIELLPCELIFAAPPDSHGFQLFSIVIALRSGTLQTKKFSYELTRFLPSKPLGFHSHRVARRHLDYRHSYGTAIPRNRHDQGNRAKGRREDDRWQHRCGGEAISDRVREVSPG